MRKMKRVLCVILAVISIFVMDIDTVSEVQAASTGKYFGYDTYVDLVEARGIEAGAVKVNVSDKSDVVSGFDDNDNYTYYTYAELAKRHGFVIPSSCVKILTNMAGEVFVGYKSDGRKNIIYRTDGYDIWGFDKNGYDRNGKKVDDVVAESEVQAASKEKFDGYSFYIELYETTYKKAGAVIVNASDKTKNFPEYTYAERARYNGYALPPSCEKLLVLDDSIVLMGYKSDGSKEIIYGMDGYDHYGYDRNGYSRYGKKFEESNYHALSGNVAIGCILFDADTGYDFLFQYNKDNKKLTYKLTRTDSKKSQFSVDDVYDTRGHSLNREHYTIKAKAKNIDKYGHGTYAVTVQTDSYYNNAKFTKTVTVIPQQIGNFDSIEDKTDDRYIYNAQYFIPAEKYMEYKKNGIVGIEYQIGPLKGKKVTKNKKNYIVFEEGKFAKNCIKGSMKFDKKKIKTFSNATWSVKGFHLATFAKQDRHIAYEFKLRSYVLVNGKKIYSEWSKGVSMTLGYGYEVKGFDGLL